MANGTVRSPAAGGSKSMDVDQVTSIAAMLRGSFGGQDMKESAGNGSSEIQSPGANCW